MKYKGMIAVVCGGVGGILVQIYLVDMGIQRDLPLLLISCFSAIGIAYLALIIIDNFTLKEK